MRMPWYLWRLLRSHPWLFAVSAVLSVGYSSVPLLIGLILREFFDALSGDARVAFEPMTLVVMFAATTVGVQVATQAYTSMNVWYHGASTSLLRRNIVHCILKAAGTGGLTVRARSLTASTRMSRMSSSRCGRRSGSRVWWCQPAWPCG